MQDDTFVYAGDSCSKSNQQNTIPIVLSVPTESHRGHFSRLLDINEYNYLKKALQKDIEETHLLNETTSSKIKTALDQIASTLYDELLEQISKKVVGIHKKQRQQISPTASVNKLVLCKDYSKHQSTKRQLENPQNLLTNKFACCPKQEVPFQTETQSNESSSESSESSEDDKSEEHFFRATANKSRNHQTEQDIHAQCAKKLAEHLRNRPTLPACPINPKNSFTEVDLAIRLPLYSCPFKMCTFGTDNKREFLLHVGSRAGKHIKTIKQCCAPKFRDFHPIEWVSEAVATIERNNFPCIGLATTRRALRTLTKVYNDESIKAVACFSCGCLYTTLQGPEAIDWDREETLLPPIRDIFYLDAKYLRKIELERKGTLLNNLAFELWHERYVREHFIQKRHPQQQQSRECILRTGRCPSETNNDPAYEKSEWSIQLPIHLEEGLNLDFITLMGVTEDVICKTKENEKQKFCTPMCNKCTVPICRHCYFGLINYNASNGHSTVPLALANDNYYGYVCKELVRHQATWLECAAAGLVWTTIIVFYLESPYGHLMLETMEGAEARTQARGNLFSFSMPWEDIEKRCKEADETWKKK